MATPSAGPIRCAGSRSGVIAERQVLRGADSQAVRDKPQSVFAPAVIEVDPVALDPRTPPGFSASSTNTQAPTSAKPSRVGEGTTSKPGAQPSQSGRRGKEPAKDPLARVALALVGADEEAEAYWYEAINGPSLSAHERQDLIEDSNEDGISDPKHPSAEDFPLIVSRLMILEAVAQDAMDEVNADAFQEAYKDLANLANLVLGDGEPVR